MLKLELSLLIIMIALSLLPYAEAQTSYTIPLEGIVRRSNTIVVQIQSTPSWAHDSVVAAMTTWNKAQVWFKNTYYPTGAVFNLVEGPSGDALVRFASNTVTCGENVGMGGCTRWFTSGTITITIIDIEWGKGSTNYLSLHEIGRVLGLGTAIYSNQLNGNPDIMSMDTSGRPAISTLDLYAVHLMTLDGHAQSATLPSQIPYMIWGTPIPEFPSLPLMLIIGVLISICMSEIRMQKEHST